eukprot:2854494-Prymnesium_polylepis.1
MVSRGHRYAAAGHHYSGRPTDQGQVLQIGEPPLTTHFYAHAARARPLLPVLRTQPSAGLASRSQPQTPASHRHRASPIRV